MQGDTDGIRAADAEGGPTRSDDEYLRIVRDEAGALAEAARRHPDATVPACPDWTVSDLVDHVAGVHRWALAQCEAAPGRVRRRDVPDRPDTIDPVAWLEQSVELVTAHLAAADLDAPTQTWAGEQDRRWWLRRLANETAVHRWDAQSAGGTGEPLDPALAADGIDEVLRWFAPLLFDPSTLERPATLHLHATDLGDGGHPGEWFVEVAPEGLTWSHRHAKGDVAARGAVSDLLLTLWGRVDATDGSVEVLGDGALFARVAPALTA